jgi:uncharacterized membrane protein
VSQGNVDPGTGTARRSPAVSAASLSAGIATALVCVQVANVLAARVVGFPSMSLAFVSIVSCLVAPLVSKVFHQSSATLFSGSMSLASVSMTLFFVTIGAMTGSASLGTASAVPLFGFIAIQLAVQLVVSLGCARAFRIPLDVMLVACNANVGGAATAVAMCIAKEWTHLVNPALLVASLGYVIGNPVAFAVLKVLCVIG